jgi:hypothetical protein
MWSATRAFQGVDSLHRAREIGGRERIVFCNQNTAAVSIRSELPPGAETSPRR